MKKILSSSRSSRIDEMSFLNEELELNLAKY